MTADDLARLREIASKASRGPWTFERGDYDSKVVGPSGEVLDDGSASGEYTPSVSDDDLKFVAAMRNALPDLLLLAELGLAYDQSYQRSLVSEAETVGEKHGRDAERADVVAWLRDAKRTLAALPMNGADTMRECADAIERGAHEGAAGKRDPGSEK